MTRALLPVLVNTRTFTLPLPAGAVAVIDVADVTWTRVAAVRSNMTFLTMLLPCCLKFLPVMVTVAPPEFQPEAGLTAVTMGIFFVAAKAETVPARPMTKTATMAKLTKVDASVMARFTISASR